MADPQGVREVFEHLPGVFFFVSDDQERHIAANSATFDRCGIRDESELVGTPDEQRKFERFLSNKLPVRDRQGKITGVMGVTRRNEKRMMQEASRAVSYLRKYVHRNVTVADLAQAVRLWERQLHRKLCTILGITPHELMLRTRIRSAAEALAKTSDSISQIAPDHGFCDHSAFAQQFRKRTGLSPKHFRQRHTR